MSTAHDATAIVDGLYVRDEAQIQAFADTIEGIGGARFSSPLLANAVADELHRRGHAEAYSYGIDPSPDERSIAVCLSVRHARQRKRRGF